jgi:hypothetical protein
MQIWRGGPEDPVTLEHAPAFGQQCKALFATYVFDEMLGENKLNRPSRQRQNPLQVPTNTADSGVNIHVRPTIKNVPSRAEVKSLG